MKPPVKTEGEIGTATGKTSRLSTALTGNDSCESGKLVLRTAGRLSAEAGGVSAEQSSKAGSGILDDPRLMLEALTAIVESAGLPEMVGTLLRTLHSLTGFEAIGLRLKDGDDYPYVETIGFPLHLIRSEDALCLSSGKFGEACGGEGGLAPACLCGLVLTGSIDPHWPEVTGAGSFWTNDMNEFLDGPIGRTLPDATRYRIASVGYSSVALVPIGAGRDVIGLMQFSDHQSGLLIPELIDQFEQIARALAHVIPRRLLRENLEASHRSLLDSRNRLELEVQRRTADLVTANERLRREAAEREQAEKELVESEERFRCTFEQAAVGMAHVDLEGGFIRINQRYCDIVGYARDELRELTYREITHPDDVEADIEAYRRMIEGTMKSHAREKRYVRKDGSAIWVELTVSPVRNEAGELVHFVAVVEDISDRRRAEEMFRKMFSASPIPVALTRLSDAVLVKVNEAWHRFTGHTCDESVGKTANELGLWVDSVQRQTIVAELVARGRLQNVEVTMRTKTGETRIVQMAAEVVDINGERHLLTMAVDRTEVHKVLEELEKSNNALRVERSMLENKNIALKEIMEQIDQYKRSTSQQLQANVNRVIRPMLQILTDKLPVPDRRLVSLLDNTLQDLIDPFVGKLESLSYSLTPREMEVCHMIRNGFSSKQIASLLNVSVFTVNNQRRSIRRKLEIADGETHLESYLKRL